MQAGLAHVAIMVLPETQLPQQAHRLRILRGAGQTTPVAEEFTMSEPEPSNNGVETICGHHSIASANEAFSGVADPEVLPRGPEQLVLRFMLTCKL